MGISTLHVESAILWFWWRRSGVFSILKGGGAKFSLATSAHTKGARLRFPNFSYGKIFSLPNGGHAWLNAYVHIVRIYRDTIILSIFYFLARYRWLDILCDLAHEKGPQGVS